MKIVTSGSAFLDIDAYGGMVAYAGLLKLQGYEATAASRAPLNESISKSVRTWPVQMLTNVRPSDDAEYILIDVSEPDFFDTFVDLDQVVEIIDHHPGFEDYWQQRIGVHATIDFIGAACTLVYEKWEAAKLLAHMSETSARLLMCGILDNTLNFGARLTTDRDRKAYAVLKDIAVLPEDWPSRYFLECQQAILSDIKGALRTDTKILHLKTSDQPLCAGQLAVWEAKPVLNDYQKTIADTLAAKGPDWFLNLISVSEGKSYFYSGSTVARQWLAQTMGVAFTGNLAIADRLWLRKEIIKQDTAKSE